ncbi:MAG: universal stress protein [Hyphomicrobiaceae bacterium]
MYKKILICTDGSELSGEAEKHGIDLAKSIGAEVVVVSVTPGMYYGMVGEGLAYAGELQRQALDNAKSYLNRVAALAEKAGLQVEKVNAHERPPYEGIVETADEKNCDLIVMASHGWRGFKQLLLGSEAKMVISHSKVPVLIYRRDRKETL